MQAPNQEEMFIEKFYDTSVVRDSWVHNPHARDSPFHILCQTCLIVERLSGLDISAFNETFVYKVGVQCHKCRKVRVRK